MATDALLPAFLESLKLRQGLSDATRRTYGHHVTAYLGFLRGQGMAPAAANQSHAGGYVGHLRARHQEVSPWPARDAGVVVASSSRTLNRGRGRRPAAGSSAGSFSSGASTRTGSSGIPGMERGGGPKSVRMLTLMEFVARRNLAEAKESLEGLYEGAPKQATARPTAERMLRTFRGVTLHTVRTAREVHRQIIGLTQAHQRILQCLELTPSIYAALETT